MLFRSRVDQNSLNQPPLWEATQELITLTSKTRRWQEAAMRAIALLSDSFSQQLWKEGFSPVLADRIVSPMSQHEGRMRQTNRVIAQPGELES